MDAAAPSPPEKPALGLSSGRGTNIDTWTAVVETVGLQVSTGETVTSLEKLGPYHFRVTTDRGRHEAQRVILAIGRRGVPRKLGVPGEDQSPHVAYALREPEAYAGDRILVVGGGDSAVEAALALAHQPGSEVRLSYRKANFARIKPANHDRIQTALAQGEVEVLWETSPLEIGQGQVRLDRAGQQPFDVPADQVFVFIGGELPTPFLRSAGVEIETHFGAP